MSLQDFHPALQSWFNKTFKQATEVQTLSWRATHQNRHTLLAAPTGSGKTLAAFLTAINRLLLKAVEGTLKQQTEVLYISPLKALSNDIQINLQQPIFGIRKELLEWGLPDADISAWVRTGDTPQAERQKAKRTPPHILVTTPESIYILLTSDSGRKMLSTVHTVIVDEIHALAGNKRGSHLTLSLQRLQALTQGHNPGQTLQRIGLSATQKPIENMAHFLLGDSDESCEIIDTGHQRYLDLALELPESPLTAIMSNEVWREVYDRIEQLCQEHTTVLVFVNTRRMAERVARFLGERLGTEQVMAHHGSMAKENRLLAEQKLKQGELNCLVATASLELGIDIGDIDLVCQLGSPGSIAAFLQRVGRSGHSVDGTPKGRIFPLSLDELVETTALLDAARQGQLDKIIIPEHPLDVLAQQIVAEVSQQEWGVDDLYHCFRQAWPYHKLDSKTFDNVVKMLADGFSTRRGRRAAYLHLDAVNRRLRPRKSARLIALTNGGAIPDQFDCDVVLVPDGFRIGSVGEDFAFESIPGDIFQLGNNSYRTLKSETGKLYVEDANGLPPNIPFWIGEAPARSNELSAAVSELRTAVNRHLSNGERQTQSRLMEHYALSASAAEQLSHYLAAAKAALGQLPTQNNIVFERFFDEVGDMHFIVHSCYGSRINKAWGLSLRKRFCRKFNFELQASALEDSIVLSLSSSHSFPLDEVKHYLHSNSVREVLIQALLAVPMFPLRWRWNATIALAVLRHRFGKRSPPYFQRSDAEDLVAILFPDQIACGENVAGDREVPDHPLVNQTIADCLQEAMDIEGLVALLKRIETGEVKISYCDLTAPSPLSQAIINAKPYAFLDDGAAEERRTLAIKSGAFQQALDAAALRQLDIAAIEKVRGEAWPLIRDADELHDALMILGFLTEAELKTVAPAFFQQLTEQSRAARLQLDESRCISVAAERLLEFLTLFPDCLIEPDLSPIQSQTEPKLSEQDALTEIIRSRLEGLGPVTVNRLAAPLPIAEQAVETALLALQTEGFAIQGSFTGAQTEWCERRLLARIHRYTLNRLRSEIEPVSISVFMRFLFDWQRLSDKAQGPEALADALQQLAGYPIPAQLWQSEILPARIQHYTDNLLESLTLTGRFIWLRLSVSRNTDKPKNSPVRNTPISFVERQDLPIWQNLAANPATQTLSANGQKVAQLLAQKGALFFVDIVQETGLLKTQIEEILGELVNAGLLTADSYAGLQALTLPAVQKNRIAKRRPGRASTSLFDRAGRWSYLKPASATIDEQGLSFIAGQLLQRYGIVFKRILERESNLPPWRDLLKVYWRMEARGEIRGGRFVESISGEQFALPEALAVLQKVRKQAADEEIIVIASADPLNLTGILIPGDKVPVSSQHRIAFVGGIPVAVKHKDEVRFLKEAEPHRQQQIRHRLIRAF